MTIIRLVLLLLVLPLAARAQTFTDAMEEFSATVFALDVAASPSEYAGRYHFGESEWESELTLTVRGRSVTGVLTFGEWSEKQQTWKTKKLRFTGTIDGNMLVAGAWKGIFVRRGDRRGLLFMAAPDPHVAKEFGYRM